MHNHNVGTELENIFSYLFGMLKSTLPQAHTLLYVLLNR